MYAAPGAEFDDGLLDVVFCAETSKLYFVRAVLPRIFKGTHVELAAVGVLRGAEVRVSADRPFTVYADGDPIGELPITLRAIPAALRVLLPERRVSRFTLKLAAARAAGAVSRRAGRGGTSLPGSLLVRLEPRAIGRLAARLERGSVVISATNGKTTTAQMAAAILERSGARLVHNRAGANMAGGIAATLAAAARPRAARSTATSGSSRSTSSGSRRSPRSCIRARCCWPTSSATSSTATASSTRSPTAGPRSRPRRRSRLVLNADDPTVADLGRGRRRRPVLRRPGQAAGARRRCSTPPTPSTAGAAARPTATTRSSSATSATTTASLRSAAARRPPSPREDVVLEGVRSARFRLVTPQGSVDARIGLPGLYNVYNALGAAALALALGTPLRDIEAGLAAVAPAFGRAETMRVGGRELAILLVKNPAGANEVLRTLVLEPGEHELLGVLNDRIADGRDVSWIWDADFEVLAPRVRARHVQRHTRRGAGAAPEVRRRAHGPHRGAARSSARRSTRRWPAATGALFALPTYTAMLALRDELVRARRGAGVVRVTPPATETAVLWHDLECGSYAEDLPLWRELAAAADAARCWTSARAPAA